MTDPLEEAFLKEILQHPEDPTPAMILADWYEEQGDPRGELLRLRYELLRVSSSQRDELRLQRETRLQLLLTDGVVPPVARVKNSYGIEFALIPPGEFLTEQRTEAARLVPKYRVLEVTKPFLLGISPVKKSDYEKIPGESPFMADRLSWFDCLEFCNFLSMNEGLPIYYELVGQDFIQALGGPGYRLPTELEWEYACRAGTSSRFCYGETLSPGLANCEGWVTVRTAGADVPCTSPAGMFPPNAFGLHDMHGNVAEWCDVDDLSRAAFGREETRTCILRSGSFQEHAENCASAASMKWPPSLRSLGNGMRLARDYVGE